MSIPRTSWLARSPSSSALVEQSIARDLEDHPHDQPGNLADEDTAEDTESDDSTIRPRASNASRNLSLIESYRSQNSVGTGLRALAVATSPVWGRKPTRAERREARGEEQSLLRDNHLIPPKHPAKNGNFRQWFGHKLSWLMRRGEKTDPQAADDDPGESGQDRQGQADVEETAPLLGNANAPRDSYESSANIDKQWEEAVLNGDIQTTWKRETKVLVRYSSPLIVTFVLQYSLNVAGVFTVGHIGKVELGAVSLASVTANITGYAVYQGLATSLDTLCAQAYGSGHKKLVGLQTQRMVGHPRNRAVPVR